MHQKLPLNGPRTHPLSVHAIRALQALATEPRPAQEFNPGVTNRLCREALVEIVQLPSPFKSHKGKHIAFLQLAEAGLLVLQSAKPDRSETEIPTKLCRADLDTVTDLDVAFGTTKLLAPWDEIPQGFKLGNHYTRLAEALFYGYVLPPGEIVFLKKFSDTAAPAALNKCVRAHIASFAPKHEHKIAGVGFLIAQVATLQAPADVT